MPGLEIRQEFEPRPRFSPLSMKLCSPYLPAQHSGRPKIGADIAARPPGLSKRWPFDTRWHRTTDFDSAMRRFESSRPSHKINRLAECKKNDLARGYHRATTLTSWGADERRTINE